jgi:ribosomal protein S18 acetylase RimI-like enzyme
MTEQMVRRARAEDAAAAAALFNAINSLDAGGPVVPMTAEAVLRDLLGPAPWAELLVAELGGQVVGFVTGSQTYDSTRAAGCWFLVDLYVAPEARRRGLGRALVAGLAALAQARGAASVWWGVDDGDDEAMAFYERLGVAREPGFSGCLVAGGPFASLAAEGAA